ncbi:MAG: oligosaccharide flippase family protein [Terracidiphilus sp.]|jgi:O-antigen/teichoic acid export membrane protein
MTNPTAPVYKPLKHYAAWMLIGRVSGSVLQAVYYVLLARLLGVSEYGIFAGAFALVSTLTPYSALGAAMLFMRYLAVDRTEAAKYWGNSLITASGFTLVAVLGVWMISFWHGKMVHLSMIVVLLIANCLFLQITTLGSTLSFALGNPRSSAWMSLLANLCRLLVLIVMKFMMTHADAFQWSLGVLAGSGVAAVVVLYQVHLTIGPVRYDLRLLRQRALEGFGFSFAGTTDAVYNDLDKIMLSHYGMNVENGFYTLAYRIIDFATSPIVALNAAVMQRHFVQSGSGVRPMLRLTFKSLAVSTLLGVAIALGIQTLSFLLPRIAGRDFSGAIQVLKFLCVLPLIRGIHQTCGSALTGAGHQNWRTSAQCTVALLNFGLNWAWIPRLGWVGAAWATLASDGSLAVLNALLLFLLVRMLFQSEPNCRQQPLIHEGK